MSFYECIWADYPWFAKLCSMKTDCFRSISRDDSDTLFILMLEYTRRWNLFSAWCFYFFSLVPAKGAEPHRTTYTSSEEDHLNTKGNKTATDQILSRGVRVGYPITGPYALSLMLCLVHQVSFVNTFFFCYCSPFFFFKLDKRWLGISLPLLPFKIFFSLPLLLWTLFNDQVSWYHLLILINIT